MDIAVLVADMWGSGGGGQTGLGLVTQRFINPGGLASEVSDGRLLSGLAFIGAPVAILRKSKGCILCSLLRGDTLMGLLLMLLGGDDVTGPLLVVAGVQVSPVGGNFKKFMEEVFWWGEIGGGGGLEELRWCCTPMVAG